MPSIVVLIPEVTIIIGNFTLEMFKGVEDGTGALKPIELLGDLVLMECLPKKRSHSQSAKKRSQSQTAKKEDRLWVGEFHIRIQNQAHEMVKDMGLDSSYRDVPMMRLRMCFWGFRNWILSLALGWRLRRAIHVLVMMGTDRWNTSVALLLKRNIIYIADEV